MQGGQKPHPSIDPSSVPVCCVQSGHKPRPSIDPSSVHVCWVQAAPRSFRDMSLGGGEDRWVQEKGIWLVPGYATISQIVHRIHFFLH